VTSCDVTDRAGVLCGAVSRTDLLGALEIGLRRDARVGDFMTGDPVAVTAEEDPVRVAHLLRGRNLKWVPVVDAGRRLCGCVRAQTLLAHILRAARSAHDDGADRAAGA
jgi:Mg/Co/Ni transporter MgtE